MTETTIVLVPERERELIRVTKSFHEHSRDTLADLCQVKADAEAKRYGRIAGSVRVKKKPLDIMEDDPTYDTYLVTWVTLPDDPRAAITRADIDRLIGDPRRVNFRRIEEAVPPSE